MAIDIPTTLLLTTFVCATIGVIFLAAWGRSRGNELELRVACAMLSFAVGSLLILMRDRVPDRLSIDVANALIVLGLGYAWSLVRIYQGLRAPLGVIVAGALVWLLACLVPAIHDSFAYRVALASLITAIYAAAAGVELVRPGFETVSSRRMIAVLVFMHAAVTIVRGGYWLFGFAGADPLNGNWLQGLLLTEPLVAATVFGVLGMALVRGRTEHILRRTAETDALTGILNRRALISRAEHALAAGHEVGRPVVLLIFDLDHFKSINDRYGHAAGDTALCAFTRVVSKAIRADDLFGRIGGEEFAAVLIGADADTGERIAERIRVDFAAVTDVAGGRMPATVSVGVAEARPEVLTKFNELFARADAALYAAKRAGRDRVVSDLAMAG